MADLVGKTLANRYQINEFIGRGGMAEVYKAWDQERATNLALKILRQDLSRDMVFLNRFQREAQILETLQHPNIVRFFGIETDDLTVFMLMDFVAGSTLQDEIFRAKGKSLDQHFISQIMQSVCSALHYAHRQGLVHCDIKPANIMIDESGKVLLTDFGIARMTDAVTATMVGFGTPAYMAPELVRGEDPTPQSDVYSLGIVLYEMVTGGNRPFTGERAQTTGMTSEKVRWEQMNLPPTSPKDHNPDVSEELVSVIMRCLAKEPSQRFGSVLELLNALNLEITADLSKTERVQNISSASQIGDQSRQKQQAQAKKGSIAKIKAPQGKLPMPVLMTLVFSGVVLGIVLISVIFFAGRNKLNNNQTDMSANEVAAISIGVTDTEQPSPSETPLPTNDILPTETATLPPTLTPTVDLSLPVTNIVDNAKMIYIPEGDFIMGNEDYEAWASEQPMRFVFLDAFLIYQTEVTNRQYRACIQNGPCAGSVLEYPENNNPAVHINWHQANVYCDWAGGRLPTEAEWEKAARGTDGRLYPWGDDQPDCSLTNFGGCNFQSLPVGSNLAGASPYGVLDMAGNVREWVADWYDDLYYRSAPNQNPDGPTRGKLRVIRGGSWYEGIHYLRTSSRHGLSPDFSGNYNGFRCVLEP